MKKTFKTPHEKKVEAKSDAMVKRHANAGNSSVRDNAKQPATKPTPKPTKARHGKLGSILGHSIVSVIRAMGKAGWDYDTANAALVKAGISPASHTLRVGLKRGRDGQKKIAPLSAAELNTLRATPAKATAKKKGKV